MRGLSDSEPAKSAALANCARPGECEQVGHGPAGQRACLVGEIVDEFGPVLVVISDVVVICCFLDQSTGKDEIVNGRGCGVGFLEQRVAVDLAEHLTLDLDDRVRADYLEVENDSTGFDRFDHVAQDVHDVLQVDSSE
jgi:hypothetical protein